MIDIENLVYDAVYEAIRYEVPFVSSNSVAIPERFPAVSLSEDDNSIYIPTLDSSQVENHATVMYTCNIYSNLKQGQKEQCKKILKLVDEVMFSLGFIRVGSSPVAFPGNIYRTVTRYRALVSKDNMVYRR